MRWILGRENLVSGLVECSFYFLRLYCAPQVSWELSLSLEGCVCVCVCVLIGVEGSVLKPSK